MMTHKERFYATIDRKKPDRPASWLGMPVNDTVPRLLEYFGVEDIRSLKEKLDDDIFPVEVPYHHPPENHIACAFNFAKDRGGNYEERTLTNPGFFESISDPAAIDSFPWPVPHEHLDPYECTETIAMAPEDYALLGMMWSAHFQDACAAFGMEAALIKMITEPKIFQAVIDRIVEFYIDANEIFYSAAGGKLDAVLIGNDLGSQQGLMLSPRLIRKFVLPGTRKLIAQAKSFGFKVIYHSCGSIYDIIPDLIEAGVDAIHPIQPLAAKMEPESLKRNFGGKVSFCGGVDTQDMLVNGTPDDVRKKVKQLKNMFPTGLIISPSHEAVLPDIDPENIEALFESVKD